MTIKDFLDSLYPGDWRLDADGNLMDANDECPLWHLYRRWNLDTDEEAEDYIDAGRRCGLRTKDAVAIAQAADGRGHPRIRKRLLVAVGIDGSAYT